MHKELKNQVCQANLELQKQKLVIYSFGNVSGIDRASGHVVIKPSGIPYDELTPDKLVVLDLNNNIIEGDLNPSSDTPTHLELYRKFPEIGGVCHTHSIYATIWAQAHKEIPAFGTTHADYFYGPVPVTDIPTAEEIAHNYEHNIGTVIIRRFKDLNPLQIPAVLVAGHGPFTWGKDASEAVEIAVILEQVARLALDTITLNPQQKAISQTLLDKHYLRKHGENAYYGQKQEK
ncbi:MAG: L-ribulose-5-phosphate 4-epimerase [Sedimentisphaerales bacterium]|nr:L-ribulose-5-phosphate 4-epimerase [Sedimentisphaerales bacterium]